MLRISLVILSVLPCTQYTDFESLNALDTTAIPQWEIYRFYELLISTMESLDMMVDKTSHI